MTEPSPRGNARVSRIAGAAAFAVVLCVALFVISPRFGLDRPSIVDDWSAYANAAEGAKRIVTLSYDPMAVHDPYRYRPGYIGAWNYLQWHTLGAPQSMIAPNLWNILRIAMFILAAMLIPVLAAGRRMNTAIDRVLLTAAAAAVPLAVIVTGPVGEDLSRFGPVELTLVSGMTLGAVVLFAALRRSLESGTRDVKTIAGYGIGYLIWLLGTYQKEASICFLAAAPFLYLYLNRRWREEQVLEGALIRRRPAQLLFAAMLVPVLHMLVQVKKIADGGTTVYGAVIPQSNSGLLTRLRDAADAQWSGLDPTLMTSLWKQVAIALPLFAIAVALRNRRVPWLALGLIAAGAALLVFQGLGGVQTSRYYLPTLVMFGSAFVLLAARLRAPYLLPLVIAYVLLFSLDHVDGARRFVDLRAADDRDGGHAIDLVTRINPWRCPAFLGGMEQEPADAFPVLIAMRPRPATGCGGAAGYLVTRTQPERITPVTDERIRDVCAGGWDRIAATRIWAIDRCGRFVTGSIDGLAADQILDRNRLVPGQRWSDRQRALGVRPG